MAAVELGKRIAAKPAKEVNKIESDEDIAQMFMEELAVIRRKSFLRRFFLIPKEGLFQLKRFL